MDDTTRTAELRRKLEKDPASRLFAQLAEELRKEGRFDEAIGVCLKGLEKNPNYPSARLTLARAFLDSGRPGDARPELEQIVKVSPDNIMASRLLGDALEDLGDVSLALQQFEKTLRIAPGDKAILEKIAELKRRLATPASVTAAPVPVPEVEAPPVDAPPAVLPSVFDSGPPTMPLGGTIAAAQQVIAAAPAPASGAALDRDLSSGTLSPGSLTVSEIMHFEAASAPHPDAQPVVQAPAEDEMIVEQTLAFHHAEQTFDAQAAETIAFAASPVEPAPVADEPVAEAPAAVEAAPEPPPAVEPQALASSPEFGPVDEPVDIGAQTLPLTSLTLADLYLQQGLKAEASAVLSQVIQEEPDNAQAKARFAQVSSDLAPAPPPEPVEHAEEPAPAVAAWPTAPLPSLPASALPAALKAQELPTELSEAAAAAPPPSAQAKAPRTRAQVREQSILGLKALLGAIEREAVQQKASERSAY